MTEAASGSDQNRRTPIKGNLLSGLRQKLPSDTVVLVHLDADTQAAWLWLDAHHSRLTPAPSARELRRIASELTNAIGDATRTWPELVRIIRNSSGSVWSIYPYESAPRRLLVADSPATRGIPWSVLYWHEQDTMLLDSTAVALTIFGDPSQSIHSSPLPAQINVAIPAQSDPDHSEPRLPRLMNAAIEADLIASGLAAVDIPIVRTTATRGGIVQILNQPGAWLHVAAHGTAVPSGIGYAGLWLDADQEHPSSEFFSWLDVISGGVQAETIILNACSLARSSSIISRGQVGFASSLISAGAQNVVAALWPVSDGAAAIWIPKLYSSVNSLPDQFALTDAVHDAQLSLRNSRAFRHPFFWASLVHFTHL